MKNGKVRWGRLCVVTCESERKRKRKRKRTGKGKGKGKGKRKGERRKKRSARRFLESRMVKVRARVGGWLCRRRRATGGLEVKKEVEAKVEVAGVGG